MMTSGSIARRLGKKLYWNDEYGIAHFYVPSDEREFPLFIRSDSIFDPRFDRVMPIWPEEQVATARLMAPQLSEGALVLDVGTGSGVYALAAAKLGCRVVAVDKSARACSFAEMNAAHNDVGFKRITNSTALGNSEPDPGEILIIEADVTEARLTRVFARRFDVVILSPPYNPTHPALRAVASHAAAGELGQEAFRTQIDFALRCMKENGICIGNHMTYLKLEEDAGDSAVELSGKNLRQLQLVKDIEKLIPNASGRLDIIPLQRSIFPVDRFLREQYSDMRVHLDMRASRNQGAGLTEWIERQKEQATHFALVVFRLHLGDSGETMNVRCEPLSEAHGRTWDDRIRLHRRVVNCTEGGSSLTTPGFFEPVSERFLPQRRDLQELSDASQGNTAGLVCSVSRLAVIHEINAFIQRERLGEWFSLIFVNGAPIQGDEPGRLNSQFALWRDGSWNKDCKSNGFIENFTSLVRKLQLCQLAPFGHPEFIRVVESSGGVGDASEGESVVAPLLGRWPEIFATRWQDWEAANDDSTISLKQLIISQFEPLLAGVSSHASNHDEDPDNVLKRHQQYSVAWSTLAKLDVKSPELYKDAFEDRLEQWNHSGEEDLKACHWLVHKECNRIARATISNDYQDIGQSRLFGVPLGLWFRAETGENQHRPGFPRHYKGAFWLYLVPKSSTDELDCTSRDSAEGVWSSEHERRAQALLRTAWFLFLASHVSQADAALETLGLPYISLEDLSLNQWRHLLEKTDNGNLNHLPPDDVGATWEQLQNWLSSEIPSEDPHFDWRPKVIDVLRGSYGRELVEALSDKGIVKVSDHEIWKAEDSIYPILRSIATNPEKSKDKDSTSGLSGYLEKAAKYIEKKNGGNVQVAFRLPESPPVYLSFNAVALVVMVDALAHSLSEDERKQQVTCSLDFNGQRVSITIEEKPFSLSQAAFRVWPFRPVNSSSEEGDREIGNDMRRVLEGLDTLGVEDLVLFNCRNGRSGVAERSLRLKEDGQWIDEDWVEQKNTGRGTLKRDGSGFSMCFSCRDIESLARENGRV